MVLAGAVVLVVAAGLALSQNNSSQSTRPKLTTRNEAQTAAPARSIKAADDFPVIGYLEGRDRTITIKAGLKGPVYSVKTADGKVLWENLSQEQLSARLPELGEFIKTGVAGTPGTWIDASLGTRVGASAWDAGRR